ncbi:hypothetical protein OG215_38195 (plasmid) [Streptomyces globisporus]|uniref:hypothetical protein n=1 Tax=Streptomyces globisporus TaxID=1908 RepID=UPI002F915A83|nr:hypothetical protein OG215_38195 [Streptomyces globisporus]
MLEHSEQETLRHIVRLYGRLTGFTENGLQIDAGLKEEEYQELFTQGYISYTSTRGQFPEFCTVTDKALNEYPSDDFRAFGSVQDSEEEMARQESVFNIPVYVWNPKPAEGRPYHVAYLRQSIRSSHEDRRMLERKWDRWVWETHQNYWKSRTEGETYGDLEKEKAAGYAEGARIPLRRANLPDEISELIFSFSGYGTLPEAARLLRLNATKFAEMTHIYESSQRATQVMKEEIPLLWNPGLAQRASFRLDAARRDFHYLHYLASGKPMREYFTPEGNPFRVTRLYGLVPHGTLDPSASISTISGRRFSSYPRISRHDELVRAVPPDDLGHALERTFNILPECERKIVTKWHRGNSTGPNSWKGEWKPGAARWRMGTPAVSSSEVAAAAPISTAGASHRPSHSLHEQGGGNIHVQLASPRSSSRTHR